MTTQKKEAGPKEQEAAASQALATQTSNLPISAEFASELEADASKGFEGVTSADLAIPYYGILQALSPQVKRGSQQIEGAREGDIINTVSQEIIKGEDGIQILPCLFQKAYVEWKPRESGGGFIKQHPDDSILKETTLDEKGNNVLATGNHIVETAYHYILRIWDDGRYEHALVSMTSSQLKTSRRWLSQQMAIQIRVGGRMINPPPPYSHSYTFNTIGLEKDSFSWFGWQVGKPKMVENIELYRVAKKFAADVRAGLVKVAPPPTDAPADGAEKPQGAQFKDDKDIPY